MTMVVVSMVAWPMIERTIRVGTITLITMIMVITMIALAIITMTI